MNTPKFDKVLTEILSVIKPHSRICRQCGQTFEIFGEDIEFYHKLHIPPPNLCPECRKQRRFGFYNNILRFYKKECAAHPDEKVISTFHPKSPYKIYDLHYWWSDKWGGEDCGKDYNFAESFFAQFQKLNLVVPHAAITHYWKGVVNSPYTIGLVNAKDCYLAGLVDASENINYSYWVGGSKDCFDVLGCESCEKCYELVECFKCYNCAFIQNCRSCTDSAFLYECRNCHHCFGSENLRNKSYAFFGQQLTQEEYEKTVGAINLGNSDVLNQYQNKFEELAKKSFRRNLRNSPTNINCLGDSLSSAKNCYYTFRSADIINVRYCSDSLKANDLMDCYVAAPDIDLCYELIDAVKCSRVKFAYFIKDSLDLEYCLECHNCQNCFGCIGLRNKNYYIFNKKYSKEEYFEKIDEIKTKMLESGEYGEFFPLSMALHSYNDTLASIEFPLSKEEVLKNGWQWSEDVEPDTKNTELLKAEDIPKDIKDVHDDILDKAIICEITGKPFRLIKSELDFYRKNNFSIPTRHPLQRFKERLAKRNPARLWQSNCAKCQKQMFTSYPPEKQKELTIWCEECYREEVV